MMNEQLFEMSEAQLKQILEACKSVSVIMLQCGTPRSPQENANTAWASLGREMGFHHMTVRPASGKGERFFYAEPIVDVKDN